MKKSIVLVLALICLSLPPASAANPVVSYFTRLLDETRAEIAIGELMRDQFLTDFPEFIKIASDTELSERMRQLAENSTRAELKYNVLVINSDIPDEIPLPGGTLILTSGLLTAATREEQRDFILARNIMHMVLKHPMKLIKSEGLYPTVLNQLKTRPEGRKPEVLRKVLRDYLRNIPKLDHKKADLQGILLTRSPENTRSAAIEMLKSFTIRIWPVLTWDTGDLPARIAELEKLKLPE
ncbi:MAG: hypothetical protein CVV41_14910 [Candidatus Riflebacteria bacterium HGW-Riflebacteria-1]|jgi:predicted Zn-dependent protease|nr:MAG: hypothetical protein CVV41_14910 [Candidatus Riflebacteria bacterium HGW-Riflebacteria-1]